MTTHTQISLHSLTLLLIITGSAHAFDGKRKGFSLGFGVGWGSLKYSENGTPQDFQTLNGFQTTLDIGGGVSDRLVVLYSGHTTIYRTERYRTLTWFEPTLIVRYYFKPTVHSFYVFSGPAAAGGIVWGDADTGIALGAGLALGGGYQLTRLFQLELGALLIQGANSSSIPVHATVNVVGF